MTKQPVAAPNHRKSRRTREVAASNDEPLSGFDLYEAQGDAASALDIFSSSSPMSANNNGNNNYNKTESATATTKANTQFSMGNARGGSATEVLSSKSRSSSSSSDKPKSAATTYNCLLLSQVVEKDPGKNHHGFLEQLNQFEQEYQTNKTDKYLSTYKRKRNQMIFAYNRAIILFTKGRTHECAAICCAMVKEMIETKQKPAKEVMTVASRLAFLLLECVLALSVAQQASQSELDQLGIPETQSIVAWLDGLSNTTTDTDPQLKFSLTLYKSRLDLMEREHGKHCEAKIRSARKELKVAMELYQHKLRSSFGAGESASVVSSANSEENMSTASTSAYGEQQQAHQTQQPVGSIVLQRHNQAALNLKASLEQLKGNVKKSLILCSEAHGATASDPTYEAVHANNLGVVYETTNKKYLALHALAKGLTRSQEAMFHGDGTACPSQTLSILYNSSLCALQAGNYLSAYECMATCVARSSAFDRAKCFLRMAEACFGLYHAVQSPNSLRSFAAVEIKGQTTGLIYQPTKVETEPLVPDLASEEDMQQVQRNPLLRARYALECALAISEKDEQDETTQMAACLSMAYLCLCFRDFRAALEYSKRVLESPAAKGKDNDATESLARRVNKRRVATATLYAAEASCALGQAVDAMSFLVGDGQRDAFDRLALDLGGVSYATAAGNAKGKRRLARAQTMVRSSASAATAATGNLADAKKLAMSAQAMEDAYESNRERSSSRRALIYCLLRGGNHSAALTLLQSMRGK